MRKWQKSVGYHFVSKMIGFFKNGTIAVPQKNLLPHPDPHHPYFWTKNVPMNYFLNKSKLDMNSVLFAFFMRTVKVVLIFECSFLRPFSATALFLNIRFKLIFFSILCVFFARANSTEALVIETDELLQLPNTLYLDTSVRVDENQCVVDSTIDSFLSDSSDCSVGDTSRLEGSLSSDSLKLDSSRAEISRPAHVKRSHGRKIEKKEAYLYPGISREQDRLALQMINEVYSFDWEEASLVAKKMQKIEQRNNLPPLSYLLLISMRVVRIQNGEFDNEFEALHFLDETEKLVLKGMALTNPSKAPPSFKTTYLFIYSGIGGFSATLKIAKSPLTAAIEGFNALKILEKLSNVEPQIKDVYLGLGIFYCAMAKAPAIVRGALNIAGRNVTFDKGIEYLRISAYQGKYTTETAKQYLIQFLSPYMGDEAQEKGKIFLSLQQMYPKNPYYLFLEMNEDICFHPEKIDDLYGEQIKKRISRFKSDNFSLRRYSALVLLQYCFVDTKSTFSPDTGIVLNEFSFYPFFLEALNEKRGLEIKRKERYRRMHWSKNGARAAKMLNESSMSSNRKNFFAWYIRDALHP